MLWFKRYCFVFVFLLACNMLHAQTYELRKQARIVFSDNEKYKDPKIDTSKWKKVQIPSDLYLKESMKKGVVWYRIDLDNVNALSSGQDISLYFTGISGKYTVYFNSNKIAQGTGIFAAGKKINILNKLIKLKNKNYIAVRIENVQFTGMSGIYNSVYLDTNEKVASYILNQKAKFKLLYFLLIIFSIVFLFTYKRNLKNYSSFYLSALLLISALLIFISSSSGISLFSNTVFYFKLKFILKVLLVSLIVLFLNQFYKSGVNKLDTIFFIISALILLLTILIRSLGSIFYIKASFLILVLIPVFYYSITLLNRIVKKDYSSLLFFIGILISIIYSFIIYFFPSVNNVLKILNVFLISLFFASGYFLFYFQKFNELFENKYILENRIMESSIIVEDKNKSFSDLNEEMELRQSCLINALEISRIINEKLEYTPIDTPEIKIKVINKTLKSFSGDVLKYFKIKNGIRLFLIDFPGDEINSAFFNLITEFELNNSLSIKSPSMVLNKLNQVFSKYNFNSFLTASVLDINFIENKIKYANAGAPQAILINEGQISKIEKGGTVIGLSEDKYKDTKMEIQSDNEILIFTDGLMHLVRKETEKTFAQYISLVKAEALYKTLSDLVEENNDNLPDDILLVKVKIK